ncbi:hypothetical protein GCM10011326_20910 [Salipiger profundus]|nr:hypothetical protein GCM10011326_20910 [Salipiger profundus]
MLDGDAILEGRDDHVFLQVGLALVDECDDRGVEFVLDAEHEISLAQPFGAAYPENNLQQADRVRRAALAWRRRAAYAGRTNVSLS